MSSTRRGGAVPPATTRWLGQPIQDHLAINNYLCDENE